MDAAFLLNRVMDPVIASALRSHRQKQKGGQALLPYFTSPVAYQRGRGLGSLVRSLFRPVKSLFKKPIIRKGLTKLGTAAAHALVDAGKEETAIPLGRGLGNHEMAVIVLPVGAGALGHFAGMHVEAQFGFGELDIFFFAVALFQGGLDGPQFGVVEVRNIGHGFCLSGL